MLKIKVFPLDSLPSPVLGYHYKSRIRKRRLECFAPAILPGLFG